MKKETTLLDPDNFSGDWYGWLTNQISHIGLGIALVFFLCLGYFLSFGEMPYKIDAYFVVLTGYVFFEVFVQGWRGLDTVEDTVFVTGYGAAGVLSGFSEVMPGSPMVSVDVIGLAPFFAIAAAHLAAGVSVRR